MSNKILQYHARNQARRAQQLTGKSITDRVQQLACNRNVGFGPKVRALFDVVGKTLESIIYKDNDLDDEGIDIFDDIDVNVADKFHDANIKRKKRMICNIIVLLAEIISKSRNFASITIAVSCQEKADLCTSMRV